MLLMERKCKVSPDRPVGLGSVAILSQEMEKCQMMECQTGWYCIFPSAPRETEDNFMVPFTAADLILGICFYLKIQSSGCGQNV